MSLNNASLLSGASVAATGGTALPFGSLGSPGSINTLYASDDSDIRTRREIVCQTRAARQNVDTPNGYTQSRSIVTVKTPLSLDNGEVTVNTVRIEIATDVETTDAEKLELRNIAAQAIIDSDFLEFWDNQSLV